MQSQLPSEIISKIVSYLPPDVIIDLCKCMPLLITKEVYQGAFPCDKARFLRYNYQMFMERADAQAFVYGGRVPGDSGHYEPVPGLDPAWSSRLCIPYQVQMEGTILAVSIQETMCIVNSKGQIFASAEEPYLMEPVTIQQDLVDDYDRDRNKQEQTKAQAQALQRKEEYLRKYRRLQRARDRYGPDSSFSHFLGYIGLDDRPEEYAQSDSDSDSQRDEASLENSLWTYGTDNSILLYEPEPPFSPPHTVVTLSQDLLTQPHKPHRFTQITSVHSEFRAYALDDEGSLWVSSPYNSLCWLPLRIVRGDTGTVISDRILMIQGSLYYVDGMGIVQRHDNRPNADWKDTTVPNGIRNGYLCFNDHCCFINVFDIPRTDGIMRDFVSSPWGIIYLRSNGVLGGVLLAPDKAESLDTCLSMLNDLGPFTHMYSTPYAVGLVTARNRVVTWNFDKSTSPVVISFSKELQVASLSPGYYHVLLLTTEGDVYSWGKELDCNGCLGLGKLKDALKLEGIKMCSDRPSKWLIAEKPVKIKLPGKAYYIHAEANYSVILIARN